MVISSRNSVVLGARVLALACCLLLIHCYLPANVLAQRLGENEFLVPIDQGNRFEISVCSEVPLVIPLDVYGVGSIPDLLPIEILDSQGRTWQVIEQSVRPGTTVFGPQSSTLVVTAVNHELSHRELVLPLSFVDQTPPQIQLLLESDSEIRSKQNGMKFVVAPANVNVSVSAEDFSLDQEGGTPQFSILSQSGDELFSNQAIISNPGFYEINVSAKDRFGNRSFKQDFIEVRERELVEFALQPSEMNCQELGDGSVAISGNLLMAPQSDVWVELAIGAVDISVFGGQGDNFYSTMLPSQAVTVIEQGEGSCQVEIAFAAQIAGDDGESVSCPSGIKVHAAGKVADEWVDLEAQASSWDPMPFDPSTGGCLNPQPIPAPCQWKFSMEPQPRDENSDSDENYLCPDNEAYSYTLAAWFMIKASGYANSSSSGMPFGQCFGSDSRTAISNSGTQSKYSIWLAGECECTSCLINVFGNSRFTATAFAQGQSVTKLSGGLVVTAPCGNGGAVGGIEVVAGGEATGGTVQVGGISIPIIVANDSIDAELFQGQVACNVPVCRMDLGIQTQTKGFFSASSDSYPAIGAPYGSSTAGEIPRGSLKLDVTPSATGPNCPPPAVNPENLPYQVATINVQVGNTTIETLRHDPTSINREGSVGSCSLPIWSELTP